MKKILAIILIFIFSCSNNEELVFNSETILSTPVPEPTSTPAPEPTSTPLPTSTPVTYTKNTQKTKYTRERSEHARAFTK